MKIKNLFEERGVNYGVQNFLELMDFLEGDSIKSGAFSLGRLKQDRVGTSILSKYRLLSSENSEKCEFVLRKCNLAFLGGRFAISVQLENADHLTTYKMYV